MTDVHPQASYKRILRTTSIVGGASLISLVVGLLKTKLIALQVGPAGIGLLGILLTIIAAWTSVAGLGLMSSGVRELAAAGEDRRRQDDIRRALWLITFAAAGAGATLLWVGREPITRIALNGEIAPRQFGWIAIASAIAVITGTQAACLQGYSRIGNLARMQLFGSVFAALASVALVLAYGSSTIIALAVLPSLSTLLVGWWFVMQLPSYATPWPVRRQILDTWKALTGLGIAITASGVIGSLAQMAARSMMLTGIGLVQSGLFQAAYTISAANLGIVLAAMGSDYYPRLSHHAGDPVATSKVIDDQLRVTLALAAPALCFIQLLAGPVLALLFSPKFRAASELLRWMIAADAMRVAGWAIGFALLAGGERRRYLAVEATFSLVYIPTLGLLLPQIGLEAGGVAYFIAYVASLSIALALITRRGINIPPKHILVTVCLTASLTFVPLLDLISPAISIMVAMALAFSWSGWSWRELGKMGLIIDLGTLTARVKAAASARWR